MNRRNFALASGASLAALVLAACSPKTETPAVASTAPASAANDSGAPLTPKDAYDLASKANGFTIGQMMAANTVYVFFDPTCPHCAEFTETAATPLRERYVRSGQVSWEYRPYMIFPTDPGVFLLLHCLGPQPFFPP